MRKLILLTAALLTLTSCTDTTVMNNDPISDITYTEPAQTEKPSEESGADKLPKESTNEKTSEESTAQPPENSESQSAEAYESTDEDICILTAPLRFDTPQEYYGCGEEMPDCYILKNPPENAELKEIVYNEQSYVSVRYYIPLAEKYENEELSEYSIERMTTITCQHKLAEDGEESFKINILDKLDTNGYVKTEINGRDYYYQPEHDPLNNRDIIIGYEVAFLQDEERMFLHIPPLDTFENMAEYLEVVKAEA